MGTTPLLVLLLAAVQVHQHGQRPGAIGPGEAHQHGQDDPLVAVAPGGKAVAGTDRITVSGLAVDLASGMTIDRIIAHQDHGLLGGNQGQDEAAELTGQVEGRPLGGGKDSLIGRDKPLSQRSGGAEDVGDGASPGSEDGRAEESDKAGEGGLSENRCERVEQRSGFSG